MEGEEAMTVDKQGLPKNVRELFQEYGLPALRRRAPVAALLLSHPDDRGYPFYPGNVGDGWSDLIANIGRFKIDSSY